MVIHGYPWLFHGYSMVIHGYPWLFHGYSMVIHGYPWLFHGYSMVIHGYPAKLVIRLWDGQKLDLGGWDCWENPTGIVSKFGTQSLSLSPSGHFLEVTKPKFGL